jgi:hypothetical protein
VTLPLSLQSTDLGSFSNCKSLATIAVPKGCQLHRHAFRGCNPQVTRF